MASNSSSSSKSLKSDLWKRLRQNRTFSNLWSTYRLIAPSGYVRSRNLTTYLQSTGWLNSRHHDAPLNQLGMPIPWLNFPAIHFLESRIDVQMAIFEFGSGNSTKWWQSRVARVVSIEHDHAWFEKLKGELSTNSELCFCKFEIDGEYAKKILDYPQQFDIVVIDGRDRVNCAKYALHGLKDDGVIVWDNSERTRYQPGIQYLKQHNFKQLEFAGLAPINTFTEFTSIFYRVENVLGI